MPSPSQTQKTSLSSTTTKAANLHERSGRNYTASGSAVTATALATTLGITKREVLDAKSPILVAGGTTEYRAVDDTKQSWQAYTDNGYPATL